MSNLERDPAEVVAGGGVVATDRPVAVLEPRDVPLGGPRAMTVRRTLPQRSRSLIGGWCFIDHYGPDDVSVTGGMRVPPHPHTGLQTVSWLFEGEIDHRDSVGSHTLVRPGELNLMTAGRGISHSEVSTAETTRLHGVQLWVALPAGSRAVAPFFEHHVPRPVRVGVATVRVFVGELAGGGGEAAGGGAAGGGAAGGGAAGAGAAGAGAAGGGAAGGGAADGGAAGGSAAGAGGTDATTAGAGGGGGEAAGAGTAGAGTAGASAVDPGQGGGDVDGAGGPGVADADTATTATVFSPLVGAEIVVSPGATIDLPLDPSFEHGVLVDAGEVSVAGTPVPRAHLAYLCPGRESVELAVGAGPARVVLLGGEPLGEQIVMWWNFIGRDHEEIVGFRAEWQRDVIDAEDPAGRFGTVAGYDGGPLPAPALPTVRLKPRG